MTEKELARFHRIEAIFDAALEYPPGAGRETFLRDQDEIDASVLEEVRQLIEYHERVRAAAPQPPDWFALVHGVSGDEPNTVKWLERSVDRHEWQALNQAVNPVFAPMPNSEGFRALEKRMGLLP